METLIPIAIGLGLFGGAFVGYAIATRIVRRIASMGRSSIVHSCAAAVALLALVPAGFLAFVVGGNLGGAWAEVLLGSWAVALGIALGIGLSLSIVLCGAGVLGAFLGVIVSRAIGKQHAA
jgi:hypothetical protein